MDQRKDHIREDIETTRASLGEKLDSLQTKARQTIDVQYQVGEHPWVAFGGAVAAGYMLGSMGDSHPSYQPYQATETSSNSWQSSPTQPHQQDSYMQSLWSEFDTEFTTLKTAAISALTAFLHDTIREYVPAVGKQLDKIEDDDMQEPQPQERMVGARM